MKPSDYPLRSSQSRAAARMLLEHREQQHERMEAICVYKDLNEPHASAWVEIEANRMHRVVRIPGGMTLAEGLQAIGGYSPAVLDHLAASHPEPLITGSMLMLKR